jgi:hypothetical protein
MYEPARPVLYIILSPHCRSRERGNLEPAGEILSTLVEILSTLVEMPETAVVGTSRSERIHHTNFALIQSLQLEYTAFFAFPLQGVLQKKDDAAIRHQGVVLSPVFNGTNVSRRNIIPSLNNTLSSYFVFRY